MGLFRDHPQVPKEGHHFPDPSGYTVNADSIDSLLAAIVIYRKNNGLPPGNPEYELEQYYRVTFPWLYSKENMATEKPEDPVSRWIREAWKTPKHEFASEHIISERIESCKKCEHLRPRTKDTEILRRVAILSGGRAKEIGTCAIFHWDCGLACLFGGLPPRDGPNDNIAGKCFWMSK